MKNEYKIIIGLIVIIVLMGFYISYTAGSDESGRYQELYNQTRGTVSALGESNRLLTEKITVLGELQSEYDSLKSDFERVDAERRAEIARRRALEETGREIASRVGQDVSGSLDAIEEYRRGIENLGGPIGESEGDL